MTTDADTIRRLAAQIAELREQLAAARTAGHNVALAVLNSAADRADEPGSEKLTLEQVCDLLGLDADQIRALSDTVYADEVYDELDPEDRAMLLARLAEPDPGIPLDDVLKELGFDRADFPAGRRRRAPIGTHNGDPSPVDDRSEQEIEESLLAQLGLPPAYSPEMTPVYADEVSDQLGPDDEEILTPEIWAQYAAEDVAGAPVRAERPLDQIWLLREADHIESAHRSAAGAEAARIACVDHERAAMGEEWNPSYSEAVEVIPMDVRP